MMSMDDEIGFALAALNQADKDMVAFEKDEFDGEDDYLDEDQPYTRIKVRIDEAMDAIGREGLTPKAAAMGVLALMEAVLLTTSESHLNMIQAAVRMTEAAERGSMEAG